VRLPWSSEYSPEDVRAVAIDLIVHHGPEASGEALLLADIARQRGSEANRQLYWRASNYIETHLHAPGRGGKLMTRPH
jgi:hypothetical protein